MVQQEMHIDIIGKSTIKKQKHLNDIDTRRQHWEALKEYKNLCQKKKTICEQIQIAWLEELSNYVIDTRQKYEKAAGYDAIKTELFETASERIREIILRWLNKFLASISAKGMVYRNTHFDTQGRVKGQSR